ncbi:monooxygenase 3-like [Oryza brachyantha]|uniref:monooxygenase 3-like n=1 Tax=Oryza brachyantha TaxID=4533 RepID=UPI001ADCFD22|nr:monooxygenase 3-like [Oryza brachyantha]XP_040379684.1 monooxygenase 3-like [Oryza brachyantha]
MGGAGAEDVEAVVVGAGIAGLATALALRRAGVARDVGGGGVVVLERHAELRAAGAALTIFPNGWFALRALGVARKLTPRYEPYETSVVTNLESGATQVFLFGGHKSRSGEVRVRPVHRRALLEAMAEELPPGTIRFSSRLTSISTEPAADGSSPELAVVRLDDGSVIRSKVLIGCDGVNSVVARWLGLSEPASSGRSCVRGLAVYPGGHSVKKELRQFLSHGLRAGMVPISDTDIYWFVVNNTIPAEKEAGGDPEMILREVTDNLGRHLPEEFLDVVRHSDRDNLTWAPLLYRAPWAILTGRAARGPVTVAGDAFHPMTPDMAQGGCAALEDAVVLARALSRRAGAAADGVAAYVAERRGRAAWIVAGAYLSGYVQQGSTSGPGVRAYAVKLFRDWIFYRFIFPLLADTMWFNCGDLTAPAPPTPRDAEEEAGKKSHAHYQ